MSASKPFEIASPEDLGVSASRLDALDARMEREIDSGRIPGAVALIVRHDRVIHLRSFGVRDPATVEPMATDAVFRIYSMTKPLTSAAAIIASEGGLLALDAPVADYLPAFRDLVTLDGGVTRRALTQMTVRHLMLHTSGIVGGVHGSPAVSQLYAQAGIQKFDHCPSAYTQTSAELVTKLAALPLANDPGTVWEYGRSGDVLGRVIEVVSGESLDQYLRHALFDPLGMDDTGFCVAAAQQRRLAEPDRSADPSLVELIPLTSPPAFISGGSGAFSTVADYFQFAQMLLHGGRVNGQHLISPAGIEVMTSEQLGPLRGTGPDYIPGHGYGFGFGVAVRTGEADASEPAPLGSFGWLGRASTNFLVDPRHELIAIFASQVYGRARHYQALFRSLVYQAIES